MICFGEAFLQGFDSLSWNYEKDKEIAYQKNPRLLEDLLNF